MLRFFRSIALVWLMASWEVSTAGKYPNNPDPVNGAKYFGCHKNVDAACSSPIPHSDDLTLIWATRLSPGKRDYVCYNHATPQCCPQKQFQRIDDSPFGSISVKPTEIKDCAHNGQ
ncbi:hypothetical protein Pst134EA_017403 [Puccinia striiformis f. sp. tritici]|nr:hypothetical protein Pst134EA_017403 [Puccinia striiformis f. sp. tritici]KAH9461094.1 hypothetical protein Pst134EA_017403 [Puccinia striiformis f. sp. tritici]